MADDSASAPTLQLHRDGEPSIDGDVETVRAAQRDREREAELLADKPGLVKWEYQPMVFGGADPIAAMNKVGDKGWEAVCVIGETPQGPLWMMKRRKSLIETASSLPSRLTLPGGQSR